MSDDLTTQPEPPRAVADDGSRQLALTIQLCAVAPDRVGEVAWLRERVPTVLGRTGDLGFVRHRPSGAIETGPVEDTVISRRQLVLEAVSGAKVRFERAGQATVRVNGVPADQGTLQAGDVIEVGERLVLHLERRPVELARVETEHRFGHSDAEGLVGEGAAIWALRSRLAFVAPRAPHVLVHGPSGTGKELVARVVHTRSERRQGPWVARSAATIPASLADAELFGNLRNYPNPGMPERPGLVGQADGGVLFLDEFGELPLEVQARLLRVLDDGEYSRLGEAHARRADLRLVAATNRPVDELKDDVSARLPLRIRTPALTERREDVGLLIRYLLRRIARDDDAIAARLFPGGDLAGFPSVTARLVAALVAHPYTTHVRELRMLLWEALGAEHGVARGPEQPLDLFGGYVELLDAPTAAQVGPVDPRDLGPEVIQACLDRHGGSQERAWRELGLKNRFVLRRLVLKYDLRTRGGG